MSQRIDPDADIGVGGFYTCSIGGQPLYEGVNDGASAIDTDYISGTLGTADEDTIELGFGNPSSTPSGSTATVTIRVKVSDLTNIAGTAWDATLMEGVNSRGTVNLKTGLGTSFADTTLNGTGISNYNNLSLQVTTSGNATSRTFYISHIKADVPDAASGGPSKMCVLGCG